MLSNGKGRLKPKFWFSDDLFADSDKSNIVSGRCGIAAFACPVGVEELAARFVGALVGVRAEVVALGLQQVGGQAFGSVAVEEGNRGSHAGHRDTPLK